MHCDALGERPDLRLAPTLALSMLSNEEVIRELLPKFQILQHAQEWLSHHECESCINMYMATGELDHTVHGLHTTPVQLRW